MKVNARNNQEIKYRSLDGKSNARNNQEIKYRSLGA